MLASMNMAEEFEEEEEITEDSEDDRKRPRPQGATT